MREHWIKCNDLPLSIFETAGTLFRASSVDGRSNLTFNNLRESTNHGPRSSSKADGFNKNISKLHTLALENLKSMGFSNKAIEDSMRTTTGASSSGVSGFGNQII